VPAAPKPKLQRIVLDGTDVGRAAAFWCKALGYKVKDKSDAFWSLHHPTDRRATRIGLQPTDERKPRDADNPLHLEVFAEDMERARRGGL
jgi:hypothetical protein